PATLLLLSDQLFGAGAPEAAEALLRQGQRQHPGDFWLNHRLAFHLQYLKPPRLDEALGFYRAALAVNPPSPGLYVNFGRALLNLEKYAEAEAASRKAIALQPDYASAYLNLGSALGGQAKHVESEAVCRKAIALQPDYALAYSNLGLSLH